jgi:class I fructose-bisphosphate aldolase
MAFSPLTSTVRDAVRLGADAVGYTIYVGSPLQDQDFLQFLEVREESDTFGMPLIVWSYPRGEAIDAKGGRDSLFAVDYAARVADELGADVVKLNEPEDDPEKLKSCPAPYSTLYLSPEEAMAKVVKTANRTMVLVSGGSKIGDGDLLNKVRLCMNAGCTGLIFGRNLWQRKFDDALQITAQIKRIMQEY